MQKCTLIFFALLVLTLVSCAPAPKPADPVAGTVDAALEPYLDTFIGKANESGVAISSYTLSMSFSDTMPVSSIPGTYVIGYCIQGSVAPSVVISISEWNSTDVPEREQLVFHELGHCLLGLQHDASTETALDYNGTSTTVANQPSSIMNPIHFGETLYNGNRDTYLKRLFKFATSAHLFYNAPSQMGPTDF